MLSIIFGLAFAILGLWGVIGWWADFTTVVRGALPFMFVIGGMIAIVAGISGIIDSMGGKTEKEEELKPGNENK